MLALLKKLFGRSQPALVPATVAATLHSQPAPSPRVMAERPAVPRASLPATPRSGSFGAGNEAPATKPAAPAPTPTPAPMAAFSKETVDLPLKPLWSKLSAEVTGCALSAPNGEALLRLPLNLVQVHLAKGSMKIPLAQFRQFSPAGLFAENPAQDALGVTIPLGDILPKLKPEQLPRRPGQRRVEVSEEIEAVFGPEAAKQGKLRVIQEKEKGKVPARPMPAAEAPAPAAPAPEAAAAAEPASAPLPKPELAPAPVAAPAVPAAVEPPPTPVLDREPIRAPKLDPGLATLRTAPAGPAITIALMDVTAFWAEKGKVELEKLYRHTVDFPLGVIQAALKKGKVEFSWRELKPWLRLVSGSSVPEIPEETKIEFPLALVAPRFFEAQSPGVAKKRIVVGEEIPDVFVKNVVAAPAKAAEPSNEVPAESIIALPENQDHAEISGEFGEIFGQPDKKEWSLNEVSQRASTLPGVAGAIIATSDGLLVGGKWPEGVGGDAVAAFVPQIYNRLTNYTNELKLGSPGNFTLLVENVPLQIFKSANAYFTVLGRAGETLPARKLQAIATRLAASPTES